MTVKKKHTRASKHQDAIEIQAFVKKGGAVADTEPSPPKERNFTLRLPMSLVESIDQERKKSLGKFSRNNWIIEAIHEKLTSNSQD
jgi:predicted HicB family RNase H-like nuclease